MEAAGTGSGGAGSASTAGVGTSNVAVAIRIRPLGPGAGAVEGQQPSPGGGLEACGWVWDAETKTITQEKPSGAARRVSISQEAAALQAYSFDHVFTPECATRPIFDSVCARIVEKAVEGFHGSIMAYGQTSSGKTHTMSGTASEQGIIELSVQHCFEHAAKSAASREFAFRMSFLEVYNEQVKCLLSASGATQEIKIQSHPTLGTVVTGNREVAVASVAEVRELLQVGEASRSVASTEMNEQSSRAHTLFRLVVESRPRGTGSGSGSGSGTPGGDSGAGAGQSTGGQGSFLRSATLNLVDLAGSENAKMTGSAGERAREAKHINQSLLTLSLIVQRLSEESAAAGSGSGSGSGSGPGSGRRQSSHMPYRDSKLTRLLENSLGGNANVLIICALSPALRCLDETNNTLKFASRAKKIKVSVVRNEVPDDKTLLRLYRSEIEQLKAKLHSLMQSLAAAATAGDGTGRAWTSQWPEPSWPTRAAREAAPAAGATRASESENETVTASVTVSASVCASASASRTGKPWQRRRLF